MALITILLGCLLGAAIFLSGVFIVAHRRKRYDLIDAAWGPAFIVVALSALSRSDHPTLTGWLVAALVGVWGLRLSWHIFSRWLRSHSEDPRYRELRKSWPQGGMGIQIFLRIYMVQAALAVLVSLPVVVVIYSQLPVSPFTLIGLMVWGSGFVLESIADAQLRTYLKTHKGSNGLMSAGLWRYSRHPNYFGEILQWWGIGALALASPLWWLALIGPMTITVLICFVSGIPPAERRAQHKDGWEQYRLSTSPLIPWFKR